MATRKIKSKNVQITADGLALAAELVPSDMDAKYMGSEPFWYEQPPSEQRQCSIVQALNWYNRFYDKKEAKQQMSNWAREVIKHPRAAELSKVDEKQFVTSYGWLARIAQRGLQLTENEISRLTQEIDRLLSTTEKKDQVITTSKKALPAAAAAKPNVQEIMRERTHDAGGEMEGWLDDFVLSGARGDISINPITPLSSRNILPQHISILTDVWNRRKAEYQAAYDGKDPQLVEGYKNYGKLQLRSLIKFCDAVLTGLNSYISVKKAAKTPRARKPVSPEKMASKVKYLKSFVDAATKLNLTSLSPAKIIGATEVWAYDTAKRKLHYYVADSHVQSLGIKGTAITGYDTTKSGVKTLRKPGDILKKLMSAGKPAARKLFAEINAVQAQPNGRTNDGLIILKVN